MMSTNLFETRTLVLLLAVTVASLIGLLLVISEPAHAGINITVNRNTDGADLNAGDNNCDSDASATGDQCTLRAAIQEANATTDADTINFNITSGTSAVKTITPGSFLPPITQPVTINGYSQPGGASPNTNTDPADGSNANLLIELSGATVGTSGDGLTINASNVVIKGLVINRFDAGIIIFGAGATNNKVEGNFIGTDPSGAQDLGNINGVEIGAGAGDDNIIGGQEPDKRNLISGNFRGLLISGNGGTTIQGNLIGTNKDGTNTPNNLGNTHEGVLILSSNNTVGNGAGNDDAGANLIAFNGEEGVGISGGAGNHVLSNSIFSNGLLGIDLSTSGRTENDKKDKDTGINNLQNFPVLTSAKEIDDDGDGNPDAVTIKGKLKSNPKTNFIIQFFENNAGEDEGREFVGPPLPVTTNKKGSFSFTFGTDEIGGGQNVTATATRLVPDPADPTKLIPTDTSEFSNVVTVASL